LEEPPAHAIFILATTEKHKIIPTILSRCQIFDFNRIRIPAMVEHLQHIAAKEGVTAEQDGLHIIAQKADGALRDALSIFDQVIAFAGKELTYQSAIENLNILDYDYYFKAVDHIYGGAIPQSMLLFDQILNNGFDGHNFINGLAGHFRDLLMCKDTSTIALLEVGENIKQRYQEQGVACDQQFLLDGLGILSRADVQYKTSKNQRLLVEFTLMQLCSLNESESESDEKKKPRRFSAPTRIKPSDRERDKALQRRSTAKKKQAQPEAAGVPHVAPAPTEEPVRRNIASLDDVRQGLRLNTVSINEIRHPQLDVEGAEGTSAEESMVGKPTDPFAFDALVAAWKNFAQLMKKQEKWSFYNTMISRNPGLENGTEVTFIVDNEVQVQHFEEEKGELMSFLRGRLNNYAIKLTCNLVKNATEENSKFLTPKDKFKKLAEKNPKLITLQQRLNLDIEHK